MSVRGWGMRMGDEGGGWGWGNLKNLGTGTFTETLVK